MRLGQEDQKEKTVSKAPEKKKRAKLTEKSRIRPAGHF